MAMAAGTTTGPPPVTLFYSYAREDEPLRQKLENQLAALRRAGLIAEWHDRKIEGGEDWAQEIDRNLQLADIVLLLVSADFIASDYCWGNEMGTALARHQRGEAKAVPVILRPCQWRETPMASLQPVPEDGNPVTAWDDEDEAFNDVAASIGRIVRAMHVRTARNGDSQSRARSEGDSSPWLIDKAHEDKATEALLAAPEVLDALRREFPKYFRTTPAPQTAEEMVQHFARIDPSQVQQLFHLVRRALLVIRDAGHDAAVLSRTQEAAAYLYCLAACRLVDKAQHEARVARLGVDRYVVPVPTDENVVCAVIATALFGGELRLEPAPDGDLPCGACVFVVNAPGGTDQIGTAFEWEVHRRVFDGARGETALSLDQGSDRTLTPEQREDLRVRFGTFRDVLFSSVALVVRGVRSNDVESLAKTLQGFAQAYQVPVMVPDSEPASALLGMPVGTLRAEIREFWRELKVYSRTKA